MSDLANRPIECEPVFPPDNQPGSGRRQVGLSTLFLLMAVIAIGMSIVVNHEHSAALEDRIAAMRPLAHELIIDDPAKISLVKLDDLWMDENRWDIHLPAGTFRLCLGTREVDDSGLAPVNRSVPLPSGRHRLSLELGRRGEKWRICVVSDGEEVITTEEPKEWASSTYTTSEGASSPISIRLASEKPLVLYRRHYIRKDSQGRWTNGTGPTEGLLLWIEPVTAPDDPPRGRNRSDP